MRAGAERHWPAPAVACRRGGVAFSAKGRQAMHRGARIRWVPVALGAGLAWILLSGCGGGATKATPTATATVARTAAATPPATPTVAPVTEVAKFDVKVGAPSADGWRWVLGEIQAGATAIVDATPPKHVDPWLFYAVAGSSQITVADRTVPLNAGTGYWLPAGQDHGHRWEPGARALVVQVKARAPERVHGADLLLASKEVLGLEAGTDHTLRVREFTIAPGASLPERAVTEYAALCVLEKRAL